ncbi:MAG: YihY/virulence factor BrkB family protein [Planctomycetaceae bacterium]|nr:YihY/virulence factor BrkB family protein [Planctomycetaceae bacterium]
MMHRLVREMRLFKGAYENWQADDGPLMSAAAAYYVGLSLFPLLLVLIAGVGIVLRYTVAGQNAEQQVVAAIAEHVSPSLEVHLISALQNVQDRSAFSGPIGLLGLLLSAIAGFAQFQTAFDRIWNIPPPASKGLFAGLRRTLVERGIALLMLLSAGLLVILVFFSGLVLSHLQAYSRSLLPAGDAAWRAAPALMTVTVNALAFTLVYRWLPKVQVAWRDALRGGVVVAVGWEIGRQILAVFLVGTRYSSAYGVVGSVIAILLWCYYGVAVIFLGAEYLQEVRRMRAESVKATDGAL